MWKNCNSVLKVWMKFAVQRGNDNFKFHMIRLPEDRFEDYIDLKMNYFVKHELTHRIAGIPESKEAMDEYKEILSKTLKHPSIQITVCCPANDDDKPDIIASSGFKLIKRGTVYDYYDKAKTEPVRRFFKILKEWNNLFPIPDLMNKYKIDYYADDIGMVVHPKFRGLGISNKFTTVRRLICKEHSIPMTGAWMTADASQKAVESDNWETAYEISYEELGRRLGVTFEDSLSTCKYMISRVE